MIKPRFSFWNAKVIVFCSPRNNNNIKYQIVIVVVVLAQAFPNNF